MPLPSNFSFVWNNLLAGSAHPAASGNLGATLASLSERGISAVLSLTETPLDFAPLREFGFDYLHLPIDDFTAPSPEQIEQAIAWLDEQLDASHGTLVHCHAGIGRTGTILACYLVHRGMDAAAAIKLVRRLRPGSVEIYAQEYAVYQYARRHGAEPA